MRMTHLSHMKVLWEKRNKLWEVTYHVTVSVKFFVLVVTYEPLEFLISCNFAYDLSLFHKHNAYYLAARQFEHRKLMVQLLTSS